MEQLLLKVPEVAQMLGIGRGRAYEMVAQGVIPSVKLGNKSVRVPTEALRRWIRERESGGLSNNKGGA